MKKRPLSQKNKNKKNRTRNIFLLKIGLIVLIVVNFIYVMNRDYFFVKAISISGTEVLAQVDIEQVTHEYLAQKKFWLFPRKNTFFLDTQGLEYYLAEAFPRIYTIDISLVERGDNVQIEIEERKAHSLWCNNKEYKIYTDEECYYADQDGYIYARSPYFSSNVFPKIFVPVGDIIQKKNIYNKNQFLKLFNFLETLQQNHDVKIQRIERDVHGDVRIYIWNLGTTVFRNNFPAIIYSEDMQYQEVLQNVSLTINHDSFKKEFTKQAKNLESIDVRFDGRIFFTFN